jgi:hypothetical protein
MRLAKDLHMQRELRVMCLEICLDHGVLGNLAVVPAHFFERAEDGGVKGGQGKI